MGEEDPYDTGMRRRTSGVMEDDDALVGTHRHGAASTPQGLEAVRSKSGGPHGNTASTDTPPSTRRHSLGASQHAQPVDATMRRPWLSRGKKRKSDEALEEHGHRRPRPMSVDTGVTAGGVFGLGTVRSPESVEPPFEGGHRPRRNPSAPKGESSRNISMRTGLFTRNMSRRQPGEGSIVEEVPSSSSRADRGQQQTGKKGSGMSVTVSPVVARALTPSPPPYARRKKYQSKAARDTSSPSKYEQWFQSRIAAHVPVARIRAAVEKAQKFVLRIQDIPPSKDGRHIVLDPSRKKALIDGRTGRAFVGNTIRSSKYTPWNFLPRQLFAQFSKLANFYFLCVSILQMIPGLSTTGNYTTIVPLLFFISVSIGKEGYEDLRRHRLDKEENNRQTDVLRAYRPAPGSEGADVEAASPGGGALQWAPVKWHALQVGDVVRLGRDEAAPADLILLHSDGPNGVAHIETMALDGETNLKAKQPSQLTRNECATTESLAGCGAAFVVEDPNLDLYNFEGRVGIDGRTSPLTNNEIVYRGSVLRNTPRACGLVMYTGEECKIRMNANRNPRIKAPSLQATVNRVVVVIVVFVVALSLFCTVAYQVWRRGYERRAWYVAHGQVPAGQVLTGFIIMFNTMIPLSLYVSMEIIKICQMLLLNDVDMYDEVTDTPFEARTSTINEELGQVSHVFSDKTGTLTENIMRFRKLSVAGFAWLHDADLKGAAEDEKHGAALAAERRSTLDRGRAPKSKARKRSTLSVSRAPVTPPAYRDSLAHDEFEMESLPRTSTSQWQSTARPAKPQPEMTTSAMIRYIQRRPHTVFAKKAKMLILSMALCHTCLPERRGGGGGGGGDEDDARSVSYQASSPDELALVQAAQDLGFVAWEREGAALTLKTFPAGGNAPPTLERYDVLDTIEFSSGRKRMSAVVRFPDGRVCVLCKGADSAVAARLRLAGVAGAKAAEVERRAERRRSLEAREALRRRSSQMERRGSTEARASFSVARNGSGSAGGFGRLAPIRDEFAGWLGERERDVDVSGVELRGMVSPRSVVSPRSSAQLGEQARPGHAAALAASLAEYDEEMVDEAVAVDEALVIERCLQDVEEFASEGLRTLLFGHRFLEADEYAAWKKVYHEAATSLVDRAGRMERAGELIERRLELGGATAIEDKLQRGVPETIDRLRRANVRLWMLTGDKRETAVNIGHACRLIKDYSTVTVLDVEAGAGGGGGGLAAVADEMAAAAANIEREAVAHAVVVVDGATLAAVEAEGAAHEAFLRLAVLADSVVCCRASPSQKAGLVAGIRRRVAGSVTLAIGDGANDIAMIQEAHVGVGITGKEGLQAARTSDYAIGQFRFLVKLLLVHGRWNYVRTCKYTAGTFWKEMLFYLTQAMYQRWNGYTGTSLYEPWSLSMFNTLFTSLPVIFLGVFEKELAAATLIAVPELYAKGQLCLGFNLRVYLGWMALAAAEAGVVFFSMWGLYGRAGFTTDQGLFAMGDATFTACVVFIAVKLQVLEIHNHSVTAAVSIFISVGGWFLWNMILAAVYGNNWVYMVKGGFVHRFGQNLTWWAVVAIAVVACVVLELAVRSVKAAFFPTDVEVFQALEKDAGVRERLEEASALWLAPGWGQVGAGRKTDEWELGGSELARAKKQGEVRDLLANGSRVVEEGRRKGMGVGVETEVQPVMVEDGAKHSVEIHEMLSRRFGSVRSEGLGG